MQKPFQNDLLSIGKPLKSVGIQHSLDRICRGNKLSLVKNSQVDLTPTSHQKLIGLYNSNTLTFIDSVLTKKRLFMISSTFEMSLSHLHSWQHTFLGNYTENINFENDIQAKLAMLKNPGNFLLEKTLIVQSKLNMFNKKETTGN